MTIITDDDSDDYDDYDCLWLWAGYAFCTLEWINARFCCLSWAKFLKTNIFISIFFNYIYIFIHTKCSNKKKKNKQKQKKQKISIQSDISKSKNSEHSLCKVFHDPLQRTTTDRVCWFARSDVKFGHCVSTDHVTCPLSSNNTTSQHPQQLSRPTGPEGQL